MDNTYQKVHKSCICREYAVHILLGYIRDSAFKQGIDSVIKDTRDDGFEDEALALCLLKDWEIWNDKRMKLFNAKEENDGRS